MGINGQDIIDAIALDKPATMEKYRRKMTRVKHTFQRTIAERIVARIQPHPVSRLSQQLGRWTCSKTNSIEHQRLVGYPRPLADRWHQRIFPLGNLLPPRVIAVAFKCVQNGWPSYRRNAERWTDKCRCMLGCSATAEDSMEHYACCPVVKDFCFRTFREERDSWLQAWLICESGVAQTHRNRARHLIGAYAVYRVTATGRHGDPFSPEGALRALRQAATEGVIGHRTAEALLSNPFD